MTTFRVGDTVRLLGDAAPFHRYDGEHIRTIYEVKENRDGVYYLVKPGWFWVTADRLRALHLAGPDEEHLQWVDKEPQP